MGSALRMGSEPLGFNPDRLVSAVTNLPLPRYADTSRRVQFYDALLARIHGLPGVAGALTSKIPPNAGGNQTIEIWGRPAPPELARHDVGADAVSSAFFEVLGIPLRRGRTFDSRDRPDSQPVAVVNEALVREYFPDADPIGQQLRVQVSGSQRMPWLTIVGVVGNLKHTQLMNEMSWVETPILYRPLPQEPRTSVQIAVRAAAASPELGRQIQQQIAAIDATVPLHDAETAAAEISKALAYPRFRAMVMSLFALGALILSAVGLHGVLSQLVAQRMPEFGVRRAVGAQTRDLLLLVARHGGVPVGIGLACGVACTLAFSRLLSSLLYGTRPADPEVLVAVGVILLTVAALAVAFPARRAASVDPVVALREE
jgi:putative ABC transport system permease protein